MRMTGQVIKIKANKDNVITIIYKDSMGNPIDITGFTARLVARQGFYTDVLIDVSGTVTGGEGKMEFHIPKAMVTGILEPLEEREMRLVVDAEMTKTDGKKVDLFYDTELLLVQSAAR